MKVGPLLRREIEQTFQVIKEKCTANEIVIACPECGDKTGHRGISLATGATNCWRCGKGKNEKGFFLAWARALGYPFSDDGGGSVSVDQALYAPDAEQTIVPLVQEVKLPKGFVPMVHRPKSIYTKLIVDMARRKNLNQQDFIEAGVGFTMETYWEPYAIFPVREYGMSVYYQGRTYVDMPDEPTKKFPSRNEVKYGAAYWVYNIDEVRAQRPETVVIVESILNVLSLRWKLRELKRKNIVPVCVFKHHISQVQMLKLVRCEGVKEFCLLFDHDAIEAAWRSVGNLSNRCRVTVGEMPMKGGNKKLDANDDVEAAIEAIEQRKLFTVSTATKRKFQFDSAEDFDLRNRKVGS